MSEIYRITGPELVTIGGGSGLPVLHDSLLRIKDPKTSQDLIEFINAIVAVYDSGGATGQRRALDPREIAYADAMKCLFSLIPYALARKDPVLATKEVFFNRNGGTVAGQDIFNRYYSQTSGFENIQRQLTRMMGITFKGQVLPSSLKSSHIVSETARGRVFKGEHFLDTRHMAKDKVKKMYLDPPVDAYPPAMEALSQAELILLSFGSLHGSVLANFLPEGMKEALKKFKGQFVLLTNLTSERNATHNFTPLDFVRIVEEYTGRRLDALIVPEMSRRKFEKENPDVKEYYGDEGSHFLGWGNKKLYEAEKEGVKVFTHKATVFERDDVGHRVVRHGPEELSKTLVHVLPKKERVSLY